MLVVVIIVSSDQVITVLVLITIATLRIILMTSDDHNMIAMRWSCCVVCYDISFYPMNELQNMGFKLPFGLKVLLPF